MMDLQEIADFYQEISREFKALGVEKVILLHAHINQNQLPKMYIELAVEGNVILEELQEKSKILWPLMELDITVIDEFSDRELIMEIYEDGIAI